MAAMALLCACSNDGDFDALNDEGAPQLSIFGTIDNGLTRVAADGAGNVWEANDDIGISTSGNTEDVSNVKYTTTTTSGNFTTDKEVYVTGSSVTVNAYYPYAETVTDNSIAFNISGTSNAYQEKDFMWAQGTVTKSNGKATLLFAHKMNRLCLTLSGGDITDKSSVTTTFEGLITSGTFNTATGVITNDKTTGKVKVSSTGKKIYMIYPPQSTSKVSMVINIGTKYYYATLSLATSDSSTGKTLNYSVTLNDAKVQVELSSVTITGWNSESGDDISTVGQNQSTNGEAESSDTWASGGTITVSNK